ncbi:hypothetical protein DPMN_146296 [Dreissena polymorpha]|uniref:Uncharacterized protein n=1 Tax=Dreissena polymorpha TaxID=45954 RepID=A0A9D4FBI0_DREPO|nr:hypothetical protein DPMN_146296 [Dreissena polymorpha]
MINFSSGNHLVDGPTDKPTDRPTCIIGKNLLTKFNEDPTINVVSSVLTRQIFMTHNGRQTIDKRKNATGGHVFQPSQTIFKLFKDIITINLLTKFHEDRTINVASRVLTRKNAPPLGSNIFQATETIFKHVQEIIGTNVLTKFHYEQTINVASRVLTRKNSTPLGGHTQRANLLTKFHEDRTIDMASRVLTRKNASPPGGHVFKATGTIFELVQIVLG